MGRHLVNAHTFIERVAHAYRITIMRNGPNNAWILFESSNDIRACVRACVRASGQAGRRACQRARSNEIDETETTTYASFNNWSLHQEVNQIIIISNIRLFPSLLLRAQPNELSPDDIIRFPCYLLRSVRTHTHTNMPALMHRQQTRTHTHTIRRLVVVNGVSGIIMPIIITYLLWEYSYATRWQMLSKIEADNEEIICSTWVSVCVCLGVRLLI